MIEELNKNIEAEITIIREINEFFDEYVKSSVADKTLYADIIKSLIRRFRIVSDTIPEILDIVVPVKKLDQKIAPEIRTETIHARDVNVALFEKGKTNYLKELDISEDLLNKLKKKGLKKEKVVLEFKKAGSYGKIANKLFFDYSRKIVDSGSLKSLILNIKKSNVNILSTTYISMMLFTILISFVVGVFFMTFLIFFKIGFISPYFELYQGSYLLRILKLIWIPLAFPLFAGMSFYFYPGAEMKSLGKRIDSELPFVLIHMGSISGSGIEPLEILKIIGASKEYKYAGKEIRKIINQTNIYGYDLSTALRNVALSTPSVKFSELLNGIGVAISSGGSMQKFFEKRAESLLLEYRLEREKSTKSAETFMDLYISIVIATPMILLMILVMISVAGIQTGFSPDGLTVAVIGIVAIVNILFLTFLHLKQPVY